MLGYTLAEARKLTYEDITPEKWKEIQDQKYNLLLATNKPQEFEKEHIRKDGTVFPVRIQIWCTRGADGEIAQILGRALDITEQKQAEATLRNQAKVIEDIQDAVIAVDLEGGITGWNEGAERMFGYTAEEVMGEPVSLFATPGDVESSREAIWEDLLEKGHLEIEAKRVRKNGEVFDCRLLINLRRDANGEPVGQVGYCMDVTESRKAGLVLAESEEKHRRLYETSPDGIVFVRLDGLLLEANKAYCDMLGYTKKQVLKLKYQELTPAKWHEMEERLMRDVIETGTPCEFKKEYIHKDGHTFPISIQVWFLRNEDGTPGRLMARIQDITERKAAEEKLRHQAALIAQSHEAITSIDTDGFITSWNVAAERLYGWTAEQAIGQHIAITLRDLDMLGWQKTIPALFTDGRTVERGSS